MMHMRAPAATAATTRTARGLAPRRSSRTKSTSISTPNAMDQYASSAIIDDGLLIASRKRSGRPRCPSTPSSPTPKSARHASGNSHGRFGLRSTSGKIAAATYAPAASPPSVVNKNKGNSEIIVIIRPHLDPGAADDPPRRLFLTGPQPSHAASS